MATLQVAHINPSSYVDGPGQRAVLYLAGCPIHCDRCQSPHLWPENSGAAMDVDEVAARLLDTGRSVTISGGEPFAQAAAVAELLVKLRVQRPLISIIVYSGFCLEDEILVMSQGVPEMTVILEQADILVDGPYVWELDSPLMQWRGSSNQRPIALAPSRASGWAHISTLNWDTLTIIVTDDSALLGAEGLMRSIFDESDLTTARMCGQPTNLDALLDNL